MLIHVVMFKLKEPTADVLQRTRDVLMSMKGKIPELLDIQVGIDVLRSERSYDLVLTTTFESLEAMQAYQVHPIHQDVIEYIKTVNEQSIVVDYITE
ncbi:Dabb family protein [Paenibacillus turpanensis]|uniref:Dabb family protein n=1 Tax=Paenibacillus turpanensis TaxID=2689078 RepID=UPI00140E6CEC|nr:Dabb family protein [Paenibacillus turpanensis]